MSENDQGDQQPNAGEDQTSQNNDQQQDVDISEEEIENFDEDTQKKIKTLNAQKGHWKEKAVDPKSGKTYKELYDEAKSAKEDKTSPNDQANQQPAGGEQQPQQNLPDSPSAEELRLIAQKGYDDDELNKLRKIAQVEDVSLSEAANSDIFSSWKQSKDAQKKNEAAQMGGSHSSSRQTADKSVSDPNLSADEHKRLWKQQMGR